MLRSSISPSMTRSGSSGVSGACGIVGESTAAEAEERLRRDRSMFLLNKKCSNRGLRPSKRKGREFETMVLKD